MNDTVLIPYKNNKKYELLIVKIKSPCKIKTFSELKVVIHNNLKNKYNETLKCVYSNSDLIKKWKKTLIIYVIQQLFHLVQFIEI